MAEGMDIQNGLKPERQGKAKILHCMFVTSLVVGILSLLCAIFVPIAVNFGLDKKLDENILLRENERSYWGQSPGKYNIDKQEKYTLFGYNSSSVDNLRSVKTVGEHQFSVTQTLQNITYNPSDDTINYQEDVNYISGDASSSVGSPYFLNLAALSTNYLVSDREEFKDLFVILRDTSEKMINNLVPYVFSMNAYYSAVNNREVTMNSILKNIKNQDQIFSDEDMGFGSIKSLSKWIRAIEGGEKSDIYLQLQDHFGLSASQMQQIAGPSSFIKALYSATQVSYALEYDCKKFCDNTTMFAIQWASQNITNLDKTFISPNVKPVESLYDLDDSLFGAPPEFSYGIKELNISAEPLNLTQTLGLASIASFDDAASIFNPRNLYDFFSSYQAKRYDNIQIKFKLVSDAQANAVNSYLISYAIPKLGNYVEKNGNKQHKAFARLLTYLFDETEENLANFLPTEVFARYVGSYLVKEKRDCKSFVSAVVKDADRVTFACQNFDFTTLIGSYPWTSAAYNGIDDPFFTILREVTRLTNEELAQILDPSSNYGKYAMDIIKDVSKSYKCINNPCSKTELAHMQFMDATITRNIASKYKGLADFLFPADSVVEWDYSRGVPLEYNYYADKMCHDTNGLTDQAYYLITQGPNRLSDYQNTINFVIDIDQGRKLDNYTEMYNTTATSLFCVLRYMTQDALLGGILVKRAPEQMIFGYDDPVLGILRKGNFTKGSDPSVQAHVSINHVYYNKTLINDTNVEVYTGNRHPEKVKTARSVNGGVYINNVIPFFDGKNVTHGNTNPFKSNIKVQGTDGLQFSKDLGKGDQIKIFDTRKIQDVAFKYSGKKSYDKINTYVYELDTDYTKKGHKGNDDKKIEYDGFFNVSSSFRMPLASSAGYFASANPEDVGKVSIDGDMLTDKKSSVENWIAVEPVSGFTIESKRNEMLSINVHEKYLALPSLDDLNAFIPVMNVQTETKIDQDVFLGKYGFVNSYGNIKFWFRVLCFPLAGVALVLSLVSFLLLKRTANDQHKTYHPQYDKLDDEIAHEEAKLLKNGNSYNMKGKSREEDLHHQDSTQLEQVNDGDSSP